MKFFLSKFMNHLWKRYMNDMISAPSLYPGTNRQHFKRYLYSRMKGSWSIRMPDHRLFDQTFLANKKKESIQERAKRSASKMCRKWTSRSADSLSLLGRSIVSRGEETGQRASLSDEPLPATELQLTKREDITSWKKNEGVSTECQQQPLPWRH